MKYNVGGFDRWARIFIGIGIIAFAFVGPKSNWAWLGLIPLLSGLFRYSLIYQIFGWSTYGHVTTAEEVE